MVLVTLLVYISRKVSRQKIHANPEMFDERLNPIFREKVATMKGRLLAGSRAIYQENSEIVNNKLRLT